MDKVKYSISDLNNNDLNLVCRVINEDEYNKLFSVCPNMVDRYDSKFEYYLTSRHGRGNYNNYYSQDEYVGIKYQLINLSDIDIFEEYDELIEYDNGVPINWCDLL